MKVLTTIAEFRAARAAVGELALVPTMGALHAGHLSLLDIARKHAPAVAASIFVNPTQFGPAEDFNKYPRPVEADLAACAKGGVDLLFMPAPQEMYPGAPEATIDLPDLTGVLEGKHRPGHFKGVCQVVAKLFNIVRPQFACFGQKDYQQLRVLSAMTRALDFPIQIIPCPTVREADGLAMSSRNRYLTPDDRRRALAISRALSLAQAQVDAGVDQTNRLIAAMQNVLLSEHLHIDYVAAADANTLKPVERIEAPTLLAIAARVGSTRLIDNAIVGAPGD